MAKQLGVNKVGEMEWGEILAGDFQNSTEEVTLASEQNLKLGSVLGKVTASGEYKLVNRAATDGSQEPYCVLMEDVNATDSTAVGIAYLTGEFIRGKLIFGGTDTWETHLVAARKNSIFFKESRQ
jgi:hypothetical protein